MKKLTVVLMTCLIITIACGCSKPAARQTVIPLEQKQELKLTEIQNPDNTISYKTADGTVIFDRLEEKLKFINGLSLIVKDGKYGIVNKYGEYAAKPVYDFMGGYHDGMNAFFINDIDGTTKVGYFNDKGEVAIQPVAVQINLESCDTYDYNFHNGLAMYRQPETYKHGFIDKNGKFVIQPIYQWAEPFYGKYAPVTKGNNYGYIDTTGKLVIPYKFVLAESFSEGLAAVNDGTVWGYINETGNYVIRPQYGSFEGHDGELIANPFIDGYAAVYLGKDQAYGYESRKGQFALIDKTGKILNGKKYDFLQLTYDENEKPYYNVRLGNKDFTIDTKGNVLKELKY